MIYLKKWSLLTLLALIALQIPATSQSWWGSDSNDKAFLGVTANRVSSNKAKLLNLDNPYGELIDKVTKNSAAEEAGLMPFDYLLGIDDENMDWTTELGDLLSKYKTGDEATVHFLRKGSKKSVKVTFLKRRDNSFNRGFFTKSIFPKDDPFLGVSVNRNNNDDELGVTVNIVDGSTADEMGLKDGDLLEKINGYSIVDWGDITRAINMLDMDQEITVNYKREGKAYTKTAKIKSKPKKSYSFNGFFNNNNSSNNRAFLGIYSNNMSKRKAEQLGFDNPYGSYVTSVFDNSAAKNAGIQPFDYIYGIDEYRVGENQSLTAILKKYEIGDEAEVHFIREGKSLKYNVEFGKRSLAEERDRSRCEDPFLGVQHNLRSSGEKGVRVDVVKNSTASTLGLKSGDIITAINGFPIVDFNDVGTAVDMMEVGDNLKLSYFRAGQKMMADGKVGSYCDTYGKKNRLAMAKGIFRTDRLDVDDVDIEWSNFTSDVIEDINRSWGSDLPTDNSLKVNGLKLIPNDDLEMFTLQFSLAQKGETHIKIFNESGRQVYNYDLGNYSGDFSDEVNLLKNNSQAYFLLIEQGNKSVLKKISISEK